jgi:hypothetical protein
MLNIYSKVLTRFFNFVLKPIVTYCSSYTVYLFIFLICVGFHILYTKIKT